MSEIIVLSDEEFYEMKNQDKRRSFLDELEKMSKPSSRRDTFTVKNIKREEPEETKQEISELHFDDDKLDPEESDWGSFVTGLMDFNPSPIESVTDESIIRFQLDPRITEPEDNKYGDVFKKEIAMLSEVLKDVKAHGTRVESALKKMNIGGKGSSSRVTGVPKGYSDLVEAYNSINTTKIQVIKAMSDLKSKQVDWQFKDKANNPSSSSESVDSIVDSYYKRIIGGGTQNFIAGSANQYQKADFEYDQIFDTEQDDIGDSSTIDSLAVGSGFNITQPIQGARTNKESDINGDEFGYITNEKNDYEIVAYQYGDNNYQLVALDEYGEPLDNVELPSDIDPSINRNLNIRPGSNFVYDKYGRSYRIVEMGSVDISDVDDMEYPF